MRRRTNTSAKNEQMRPKRSLSSPSRPRRSFSDFELPEKPPVPRSLWDYLQVHLQGEQPYTEEKNEHLLSLIKVPLNLEKIMAFGFLTCLDSFLYTVTIMPLKVVSVLWKVAKRRSTRHVTMTNMSDLLKAIVVLSTMTFLLLIDTSKLYHNIRGQNAMKLYVMFNVLEITDKLCAAWGLDVLESLFSAGTLNNYQRLATYMLLYMAYSAVHSGVLLYQIVTLNVAVNSYSNALLTLLLSNQFNEVKSTVFKRFERESLFQLTCADITERFQLWVLLVSIGLRNVVEVSNTGLVPSSWSGWNRWLGALLGPGLVVLGSEVAVDWLKHSYIAKFNNFRPRVYRKFLDVLTQDYYEHAFNDQLITRRMGLPTTALACVFMRMCYQSYQILFESGESRFVKGTPTVSPQLSTLAQVDTKFVNNVSVSEIAQATRTFFSSLYNGTSPLVSFSSNIIPVWAKFDIYYVSYLLTMMLAFALVFAVLVIFKLFLGLTLLKYSHSKRRHKKRSYEEMDKSKEDYLPGKTRGGQGVIELTDDMQKGLYSDGEEKEKRKKVVDLQTVSRFDMVSKRIW
ncbi:Endoplasmic reticulum membrane protein 65 [Yarrowia sp. B02]|nr:Endoplasmic reticulum membrane protein 65 [Yarrowia sp. B02]